MKRILATIIAGLLLLMLILPQVALAQGPEMSKPIPQELTSTTVTIYWTTNSSSIGCVYYGTNTTAPGSWPSVCDSDAVGSHFIKLTGLTPSTTYYYWIQATDTSGTNVDKNYGTYYSFTTGPPTYSITLEPACGVCGELVDVETCQEVIEATGTVAAAGTYRICWDSRAAWDSTKATGVVDTFKATTAGSYHRTFFMPEAKKDIHTVYLTTEAYVELKKATFEVFPSVKIDPEEGPVDTNVTFNLYGFDAKQAVRIKFRDSVITPSTPQPKTDDKGSWTVSYTIPDTPAGGYTFKVEAKEGTVWVGWVSKHFTVTPEITAPSSGKVGHTIEVKGTGFKSKEKDIEVTFRRQSTDVEVVVKESILADENGSWTATIVIPPLQRGTYTISASGELTRARDVFIKGFIVGAGILVDTSQAYVGDMITVMGGGFAPGETGIKVYFEEQVVDSDITAKIDGSWKSSFVLLASTYGSHTVSASGDITKPAVKTTLTTKARIESVSPAEGSPGDPISLTGSGFSANKKLTVTVGGVSAAVTDSTRSNGDVVISFRVPKEVTIGKQTLKVTDEGGASAERDFTVISRNLAVPLPVSPQDITIRSGMVTFSWQGITGDSDFTYTYTLEISETAGFTSIFRSRSDIEELSTQLPKEYALPKGTYYWRVKAVDDYGNESEWSDSIKFTVSPIPRWVWVLVGLVVLVVLMVVAYRETKFKVTE